MNPTCDCDENMEDVIDDELYKLFLQMVKDLMDN
jgi:hypothetical protein